MQELDGRDELLEVPSCSRLSKLDGDETVVQRHGDEGVAGRDDERLEQDDPRVRPSTLESSHRLVLTPETLDACGGCRVGGAMDELDRDLRAAFSICDLPDAVETN